MEGLLELQVASRRQFIWGLSGGVTVLAFAGLGWIAIGLGPQAAFPILGWSVPVAVFVLLLGANRRLRVKAHGFNRSNLKSAAPAQRMQSQAMMRQFLWVSIAEGLGCIAAVYGCRYARRLDLISTFIALVVSIHFLPLGRIFRVPTYFATGMFGVVLSLCALFIPSESVRVAFIGVGMGFVLWLSAIYILWNAERIVDRATVVSAAAT